MVCMTRRHILGGAAATLTGAAIAQPAPGADAPTIPQPTRSTGLIDDVINVIERQSGVSRAALLSQSRDPDIVWARQRAMYVVRLLSSRSLPEIGRRIGGRNHMTVIHACRKIELRRTRDPVLDNEIDDLIHACIVEAVRNNHRFHPHFDRQFFKLQPILLDLDDVPMPPWS